MGSLLAALACAASLVPGAARACPSCYGSASGPVIDGMNLAVLVMVGVTGGVFSWIIAFALRVARRERGDRR
jgi:heme/copper-type cytochrome/quinol oxidase subunit 2